MVSDTHEQIKECHSRPDNEAVINMFVKDVVMDSSSYFQALSEIPGGLCD
jgi:hypothetical protein